MTATYSPADHILPRLDIVRELPSHKHAARHLFRCPGPLHEHGDRNPSAIATETHEGAILFWCNAGCDPRDIASGAGLELRDCFPRKVTDRTVAYQKPRISYKDALLVLRHEAWVLWLAGEMVLRKHEFTCDEWQRVATAVHRIHNAAGAANA
jgi:hypothetical protein